jgi:uncharacterized protein (TIGR02996 family)
MFDKKESFLAAIEADPKDTFLRLVYGDFLEEQGDAREAENQREIANGVATLRRRQMVDGKIVVGGTVEIKRFDETMPEK